MRVLPDLSSLSYNKLTSSKSITKPLLGNNLTEKGVSIREVSESMQRGVADYTLPRNSVVSCGNL